MLCIMHSACHRSCAVPKTRLICNLDDIGSLRQRGTAICGDLVLLLLLLLLLTLLLESTAT
jgi:hypothetical protein